MSSCKDCGAMLDYGKMLCQKCGGWTAVDREIGTLGAVSKGKTIMLNEVDAVSVARISIGGVWDDAWGGGLVPTSTTLMGGSPGAGKTTGLLQIASQVAAVTGKTSYYFSAEQAPGELKMTVDRLQLEHVNHIRVIREFGIGAEIDEGLLKEDPPGLFVLDSVSALCGQDKQAGLEVTKRYKKVSAKWGAPTILICQMTKENDYAGFNSLQHEVDTLMTIGRLDGDREILTVLLAQYPSLDRKQLHKLLDAGKFDGLLNDMRVLTPWKHRYGPTGRDYPLMMTPHGLSALPPLAEVMGEEEKKKDPFGIGKKRAAPSPRPTTVIPPPSSEANVIGDTLHPKAPDAIEVNGQKLKKVKKKKKGWFTAEVAQGEVTPAALEVAPTVAGRMAAVEGDAKKWKRPPMPRTKEGKREAVERRKVKQPAAKVGKAKKEARA